ncbi:MAG TPA: hypothetical protein H9919_02865 [Candidatus Alistipes excrementipullorum]|nr:hypothetical protein [Candidatus Alistipes excrementipullorum]
MNRAQLETALRDIAADAGYSFRAAGDEYASRSVKAYPAAWLSPPVMHSIEGRRHGRISYDVTLHLLDKGAKLSLEQRNAKWDELESDALAIFTALSEKECVIAVENLEMTPRSSALTNHGVISQTVTARVTTCF